MITSAEVQALAALLSRTPMSLPEQVFAAQLIGKLMEQVPSEDTPNSDASNITDSPSADGTEGTVDK